MRGPERRVIAVLRAGVAGGTALEALKQDLGEALGAGRAAACLAGFAGMRDIIRRHGWHVPVVLPEDAQGWSEDELSLARFVLAASEQQRDVALAEASFLVSPMGLLPLLEAGMQAGLPLLCEECRARLALQGPMGRA
ncbi:hypothetical protein GCM10011324_08610 [Allosediminivita pacifica]|nr:hypothetical protein GCM10011324_08610 [Allosediminivita pacifica]